MAIHEEKIIDIPIQSKIKIIRNLSYQDYFSDYSRQNDGRVTLATYSFNAHAINDFHKLMPFSTLFIAANKENEARRFARRFPLYIIYLVPNLHSKVIFFHKSRKMLIGSQNLYDKKSNYEELSCEFLVPNENIDDVFKVAFCFPEQKYLRVEYETSDIKVYNEKSKGFAGKAYFPCHEEVKYWEMPGPDDSTNHNGVNYIYCILMYSKNSKSTYLAFDRNYQFCGELSESAFIFLNKKFKLSRQNHAFLSKGEEIMESAPFKDQFAIHHPIAKTNTPTCAYYINY